MRRHMMFLMLLICFALLCACSGEVASAPAESTAEVTTAPQESPEPTAESIVESAVEASPEELSEEPAEEPSEEPQESQEPEEPDVSEGPEEDPQEAQDDKLQNEFIPALEMTLKQFYGDNYKAFLAKDPDGGMAVVSEVWKDGTMVEATFAASDFQDYKQQWDDMIQDLLDFSVECRQQLDDMGLNDYKFVLQVMNDIDTSKIVVQIKDDTVEFNVVDELAKN